MKIVPFALFLAASLVALAPLRAASTNVQKSTTTNEITGDLSIGSGRTLTVGSGGTFTAGSGSILDFSTATVTYNVSLTALAALTLNTNAINILTIAPVTDGVPLWDGISFSYASTTSFGLAALNASGDTGSDNVVYSEAPTINDLNSTGTLTGDIGDFAGVMEAKSFRDNWEVLSGLVLSNNTNYKVTLDPGDDPTWTLAAFTPAEGDTIMVRVYSTGANTVTVPESVPPSGGVADTTMYLAPGFRWVRLKYVGGVWNRGTDEGGISNVTTTDPTSNDDVGDGYQPGVTWLNTTDAGFFVCQSAASGAASWVELTAGSGITDLVQDTTPQLGGDLDLNTHVITGMVIGTNIQAYDADLTTYAGLTPAANTQTFLGAANYAAMRTQLGLVISTNVQAYDADLTTWAGITPAVNTITFLGSGDFAEMRTNLSLVPGTNVQAYDADLTTWAGVTPGTGVATALAVNVGTAGAPVINGGALGTPSSGVGTALTALNGENIQDDTIDDDSIDFGTSTDQVSAGDLPVADTGSIFTATDVEAALLELAKVPVKSTATSYTVGTTDAREAYGGVITVTGAATITAPAAAAGMSFTVITHGAIAVSVDVNAADLMWLDGVALDDGDKATNTSTTGDIIVFTYFDSTGWNAVSNAWTDGGP